GGVVRPAGGADVAAAVGATVDAELDAVDGDGVEGEHGGAAVDEAGGDRAVAESIQQPLLACAAVLRGASRVRVRGAAAARLRRGVQLHPDLPRARGDEDAHDSSPAARAAQSPAGPGCTKPVFSASTSASSWMP